MRLQGCRRGSAVGRGLVRLADRGEAPARQKTSLQTSLRASRSVAGRSTGEYYDDTRRLARVATARGLQHAAGPALLAG